MRLSRRMAMALALCLAFSAHARDFRGIDGRLAAASEPIWRIAASTRNSVSSTLAAHASQAGRASLGADHLSSSLGVTGLGQRIAIVDSGIDAGWDGLRDSSGVIRVRGWADTTGEGLVHTTAEVSPVDGLLAVGDSLLRVGALESKSGSFLVGSLRTLLGNRFSWHTPPHFVVFDPFEEGRYEAVVIDTDSDLDLADEVLLFKYDSLVSVARMKLSTGSTTSVVVTDIQNGGTTVSFGFDLNGHGTELAAIVGSREVSGFVGVAPECEFVAIKAIRSDGQGTWSDILAGLRYALDSGATVILIGSVPDIPPKNAEWAALQASAKAKGAHIVMPAGNSGPGIGSITLSADPGVVLLAGGYLPDSFLQKGDEDVWYPFTSTGPDPNGDPGVSVLAPAVTAVPARGAEDQTEYRLMEGTSVSAAYLAGGLALLRQGARVNNASRMASVTWGVCEGALPLPGLTSVEQGHGRFALPEAWSAFQESGSRGQITLAKKWDGVVSSGGLLLDGYGIGAVPLWVDNLAPVRMRASLSTTAPWLACESLWLDLGPVSQRETWLKGSPDLEEGFHTAQVQVDDPTTPGTDGSILVSAIIPEEFSIDASRTPGVISSAVTVDSQNRVERRFVRVPASAQRLVVDLHGVPSPACYAVYNPEGILVNAGRVGGTSEVRVGLPIEGIWQVCVFMDPSKAEEGPIVGIVESRLEGTFAMCDEVSKSGSVFVLVSEIGTYPQLQEPATEDEVWRYRASLSKSRDTATMISFPEVSDHTAAISLRFGSVSGTVVRAYLYHLDPHGGKWVEVASGQSGDENYGEILYPGPLDGKYIAYVERYGSGDLNYGEIEALLIPDTRPSPVVGVPIRSEVAEHSVEQLSVGSSANSMWIIKDLVTNQFIGVIEQPDVRFDEIPLVHLMGVPSPGSSRGVKTLRAWTHDGRHSLDITVVVGRTAYQLDMGRVTALFGEGEARVRLGETGTYVIVP